MWEDPFTVSNASFPCSINRVHGPLYIEEHTYLINHSLHKDLLPKSDDLDIFIPDTESLPTTNSLAS